VHLPLQVVIDQLRALLDQDLAFMAAVLDCISNMQLEQHLQVRRKPQLYGLHASR
jgi:hypothetical protein